MSFYIRWMDALSRQLGMLAAWALFLACAISAGNALVRYTFNLGSNAWLEAQWYLFGLAVMAGAPMLLKLNEHVRVDVIYGSRSPRTKAWIDALGFLLVLLPEWCWMTVLGLLVMALLHLHLPTTMLGHHGVLLVLVGEHMKSSWTGTR